MQVASAHERADIGAEISTCYNAIFNSRSRLASTSTNEQHVSAGPAACEQGLTVLVTALLSLAGHG